VRAGGGKVKVVTQVSPQTPGTKFLWSFSSSSNLFLALQIQLVGPVKGGDLAAGSSKVIKEASKKKERRLSKGKGKRMEVEDIKVEGGIGDLDKQAACWVRLLEVLARKRVDLELLEYEIKGIEKMLAN
jgi:hypothetical protein